ncbi:MAG: hypothetical protein VX498_11940 [Myxococcota bacterium]|nr:hypothetical protein [Myxococcota bacterium]
MIGGSAQKKALLVVLGSVLLIGLSMFAEPQGIASADEFRNNDWLNCRSFDVLSRRALLEDGEFPLRTHLIGGGFPVAAHPSDGSWSPTLLAVLLFGDAVGVKINILILMFLGSWGVWLLGRRHLGLDTPGALFAACLFAFSGWLPSMLLVGFYNQVFYLLVPLVLYLVLEGRERADRLVLAGFLLLLVLQQGGHAFPASVFFLGVVCWLMAASEANPDMHPVLRWLSALALLLLGTAPMAVARGLGAGWPIVVGWGLALLWMVLARPQRAFARALGPWALRLGLVLLVTCSLGSIRLVGLTFLGVEGSYEHRLQRKEALWFPDPFGSPIAEERFYEGPSQFLGALVNRVPSEMEYGFTWGRTGDPLESEYAYLGLTPLAALLAGFGLLLLVRRRGSAWVFVSVLLFLGVCFGWRAPPDLHFLLTWGLPFLESFSQPIKYWNFFVLLGLVLASGVAVEWIAEKTRGGRFHKPALAILFATLLWPLAQNRVPFAETFEFLRPAPEEESYRQVMTVADSSWLGMSLEEIQKVSKSLHLRDYERPIEATEYYNIRRGVGTVDWYGSLVLEREQAEPAEFLTLAGETLPNPRYRGEAWVEEGEGEVLSSEIGHNRMSARVRLESESLLVFNQNWLEGFQSAQGEAQEHQGLLALRLGPGEHEVSLNYSPASLRAAFAGSFVSLLFWGGLFVFLRRRKLASR